LAEVHHQIDIVSIGRKITQIDDAVALHMGHRVHLALQTLPFVLRLDHRFRSNLQGMRLPGQIRASRIDFRLRTAADLISNDVVRNSSRWRNEDGRANIEKLTRSVRAQFSAELIWATAILVAMDSCGVRKTTVGLECGSSQLFQEKFTGLPQREVGV
jgi:hypothetical protein